MPEPLIEKIIGFKKAENEASELLEKRQERNNGRSKN
jgi:hypothetical protein